MQLNIVKSIKLFFAIRLGIFKKVLTRVNCQKKLMMTVVHKSNFISVNVKKR